jgi:hypothetical protein
MGSRRVYRQDYMEDIAHAPTAMADWSGELAAYEDRADCAFPEEDWHDLEPARPQRRQQQQRPRQQHQRPRQQHYVEHQRPPQYVETPLSVAVPVAPPAPSSLAPYMLDEHLDEHHSPGFHTGESPVRMPWEVTSFMVRAQQRARLVTIASVAGAAMVIAASVILMLTAGAARERELAGNAALPTMALPPTITLPQPNANAEPLPSAGVVVPPGSAVSPPGSVIVPPSTVVAPRPLAAPAPHAIAPSRPVAPAPPPRTAPRPPRASTPVPPPQATAQKQPQAQKAGAADDANKKVLDEARHETDDSLN